MTITKIIQFILAVRINLHISNLFFVEIYHVHGDLIVHEIRVIFSSLFIIKEWGTHQSSCKYMEVNIHYFVFSLIMVNTQLGLGLRWLTPLSTIFQLYRGGQFYWWKEPGVPGEKCQPLARHRETTKRRKNMCWTLLCANKHQK